MENIAFKEFIKNNINEHTASEFIEQLNAGKFTEQLTNIAINEVNEYVKSSTINTINDLANLLNNNQYKNEFKNDFNIDVIQLCKDNNWVIIYPQSDDLLEVRGVIEDEFDICDNGTLMFTFAGEFYPIGYDTYKKADVDKFVKYDTIRYENKDSYDINKDIIIDAEFNPEDYGYMGWHLNYNVPDISIKAAEFNIKEDNDIYSNAIIIDLSNVLSK